jgi:hypothetical protein
VCVPLLREKVTRLIGPVMHSEELADHDKLKSLIDARRAEAQSDVERAGIDLFMDFEQKHRE